MSWMILVKFPAVYIKQAFYTLTDHHFIRCLEHNWSELKRHSQQLVHYILNLTEVKLLACQLHSLWKTERKVNTFIKYVCVYEYI